MPVGDCYEAAGKWLMDNAMDIVSGRTTRPDVRLVHGEVIGRGALEGVRFGHAWIEDGDEVIDPSNDRMVEMPKSLYYALGGIDHIDNMHRYDVKTFRRKVTTHRHWGPWDLETSTGL